MLAPQGPSSLSMAKYLTVQSVSNEPCEQSLKIMSWNILAERLVSESQFPYVDPTFLDYRYRIDIVFISRMNCTILALQEVDPTKTFFTFLEQAGYEFQYRPKGYFQGILIAYKKEECQLLDWKIVDYDEHLTPRRRRFPYLTGHGALLVKLLYKGKHTISICNTHLHWVPKHQKVKYHQTCTGLTELNEFSRHDVDPLRLFVGDFNSLPDCNGVRLVVTGQPPFNQEKYQGNTLKEICQKYEENKHKLIKMKSAYEGCEGNFTNLTDKFVGTIDYIFYSESPTHFLKDILKLPLAEEVKGETALPNSEFPSDHLPLVCSFGFKKA